MQTNEQHLAMAKSLRNVAFFFYNVVDSQSYEDVAKEIHGTDLWTYKWGEVIFGFDCRAWHAELLFKLPEEQAAQIIAYCDNYYKNGTK